MTIVESKVAAKTLEVRYQIANNSRRDILICESIFWSRLGGGTDYEVYLSEDSQSLIIRRRLNVPAIVEFPVLPYATYLRLSAGEKRTESIVLVLPIQSETLFYPRRDLISRAATRLRMEIGVYDVSIIEEIFDKLDVLTKSDALTMDRDRIFLSPYAAARLSSHIEQERTVWAEADIPRAAFVAEEMFSVPPSKQPSPPDLSSCTRIQVEFHPSVLEYFFPDPETQSLLNDAEREPLRSQKSVSSDRPEQIAALQSEIGRGEWSLIVAEETYAKVVCWSANRVLTSFATFGDRRVLMDNGTQFRYANPLTSLRALVPQIEPYRQRAQRARALKSLWYEIRTWHRNGREADSFDGSVIRYPPASRWDDAIREAYQETKRTNSIGEPYREGASEYAMNPDCTADSPVDTVLLFETHVGWNRHGGPELFTFENYNPPGGLVLLNNGTVKFVRTEEELRPLRWR